MVRDRLKYHRNPYYVDAGTGPFKKENSVRTLAAGMLLVSITNPQIGISNKGAVWPPFHSDPLNYLVKTRKVVKLSKETLRALKKLYREKKLKRPPGKLKQYVENQVFVSLRGGKNEIIAEYETRTLKHSLRMKIDKSKKTKEPSSPLGSERAGEVWGYSREGRKLKAKVPLDSLSRKFRVVFTRNGPYAAPRLLNGFYGDHLLPVMWNYPLPCWVEAVVPAMELDKEAPIPGKSLIRDASLPMPLGDRHMRIEVRYNESSGGVFAFTYKLELKQMISWTRDREKILKKGYLWLFEIQGKASYSTSKQAFTEVKEKIRARLKDPPEWKLMEIHDEEFEGSIEARLLHPPAKKKKK